MIISVTTDVRLHEGEGGKDNPAYHSDEMVFLPEALSIEAEGGTNGEPEVRLELTFWDNPKSYVLGRMPESIRLNIPMSTWDAIVAKIATLRQDPKNWLEG